MPAKSPVKLLQELENLQKRLARTEKIARLGHWCLNLNTPKMYWSDEVFRLFDKEPRTFTPNQATLLDSVHPDDREPILEVNYNRLKAVA